MIINAWLDDVVDLLSRPLLKVGHSELTLGRLTSVLGLVLFAYVMIWLIDRGLKRLVQPGRGVTLSESAVYALSRISRYTIWVTVVFTGLDHLGINFAHLAIVGGAIGVGIGFGLQNIFSNFISGVVLLLEQTLKVGDFVDLQSGVVGSVAEIGIRYTRVTTNDSVDVIVPNSEFINGRVTNWTFNDRFRRIHVPFGVAYGSDKERVRTAALAAAAAVQGSVIDDAHPVEVWLVKFGDSSLNFELVVWIGAEVVTSPGGTHARYLWALETELVRHQIEIPFPQRDLHIRSGTLKVDAGANASESTAPRTT